MIMKTHNKDKFKKLLQGFFVYLELIIMAVVVIYPVLWIVGSSFNPKNGVGNGSIIPAGASLVNYIRLLNDTKFPKWYSNTFYIAVVTMVCSICINTITAYVFARLRFKFQKLGIMVVMILQLFPSFLALTALYMVALNFGMLNNLNMLVIIYVAGSIPNNIWVLRGYMRNLPRSLDEAAYIDGATKFQVFYKIIVPLSVPIISFIAVTSFIGPWMDYMLPRFLINKSEVRTLAIGLFDFLFGNNQDFTAFAAGAVLVGVPITIIYIACQKFLLEGLTAGANKGE